MTQTRLACTLSGDDARDRAERWRRLLAVAVIGRERTSSGHRLTLRGDAAIADELAELVAAEGECCPFLALSVRRSGDELVLDASAPPDARPILEELLSIYP
jgi:hypothetical protein